MAKFFQFMTRIFSGYFLVVGFGFLLGLGACEKGNTIINGTITDAKTGLPIQGASISYGVFEGPKSVGAVEQFTDNDGKFTIETGNRANFSGLTIMKTGYVKKQGFGTTYTSGTTNNIAIIMYPKDGILKLIVKNTSSQTDSIYVGAYSPIQDAEYDISQGIAAYHPFVIQGMMQEFITFKMASEETVDIYWGFTPMTTNASIKSFPFHDSKYIGQNDTTVFNISF